jgi:hypothetical protein
MRRTRERGGRRFKQLAQCPPNVPSLHSRDERVELGGERIEDADAARLSASIFFDRQEHGGWTALRSMITRPVCVASRYFPTCCLTCVALVVSA